MSWLKSSSSFIVGLAFICFFSLVNYYVWGDMGPIHLLGHPVPSYALIWLWIALIASILACNQLGHEESRNRPIWLVISIWWTGNIGVTTILGAIDEGRAIGSNEGLILDFLPQASFDLFALGVILALVVKNKLNVSVWLLIFCGFLVANLFGHTAGAYNVMVGAENAGDIYDSYLYLVFTVMLVIQALGSGLDALLRWSGKNVDVYRDVRPYCNNFAHRYLPLS